MDTYNLHIDIKDTPMSIVYDEAKVIGTFIITIPYSQTRQNL
jgi:hypothetical protein